MSNHSSLRDLNMQLSDSVVRDPRIVFLVSLASHNMQCIRVVCTASMNYLVYSLALPYITAGSQVRIAICLVVVECYVYVYLVNQKHLQCTEGAQLWLPKTILAFMLATPHRFWPCAAQVQASNMS